MVSLQDRIGLGRSEVQRLREFLITQIADVSFNLCMIAVEQSSVESGRC